MRFLFIRNALACIAVGVALAITGAPAGAQSTAPLTPRSSVPAHDKLKQSYEIANFRLGGNYNLDAAPETWRDGGEGGTTLESLGAGPLRAAYIAVGSPKRDDKGQIVNAVVISSFYSGDATASYNFWYEGQPGNAFARGPVVGPGRAIDTDKFYVVFVDAIGLWARASPPTDSAASSRCTARSIRCRPTTDCCATTSRWRASNLPPACRWAARRAGSGA